MTKNLNRRKFSLLSKKKLFYTFFFILFTTIILITYLQKNLFIRNFDKAINLFSETFDYQFLHFTVNNLYQVEETYLKYTLKKYKNSSIFLLPLEKISNEIKENNWIKDIKLRTNYKDTLIIDIEEYESLGIYKFNDKFFYFDSNGKIIDEVNNKNIFNDNLIIFIGQSSNLNSKSIIDILSSLKFQKKFKIKNIYFINKRRWNIILNNNIKLMLSENNPKNSIENFIDLEKKLSETEMNNIKSFDLRNINKVIIDYN